MIALKNFIEKYTTLLNSEWGIIEHAFEKKEFVKNEIIHPYGKICKHFYFLEKGLLRYFMYNDGEDITKYFVKEPNCFTSRYSFRTQKPSEESIQALDKTTVWQTSFNQISELQKLKSWNVFISKYSNDVQMLIEELLIESKTETAEKRYGKLLKLYPDDINKIPLKHLSTFLGIAPQSLSRIRKKIH